MLLSSISTSNAALGLAGLLLTLALPSPRSPGNDCLAGAEANLKSRAPTAQDDEAQRLKSLVGDLTMRLELSREKIRRMESGDPLARRRSRR